VSLRFSRFIRREIVAHYFDPFKRKPLSSSGNGPSATRMRQGVCCACPSCCGSRQVSGPRSRGRRRDLATWCSFRPHGARYQRVSYLVLIIFTLGTILTLLGFGSEVRRAVLFQLDPNPTTLPAILRRARDVDPVNRRLVFHSSLAEFPSFRVLTPEQRDQVVRRGLSDREPGVRRAASRLVAKWAAECEGGLLGFLKQLGVLESTVAEDALASIFEARPELVDAIDFDGKPEF
jgi:hypothetical protein